MKRPRSLGNRREDRVAALLDARGFHTIVRRGSGARGSRQQALKHAVAGDVIALGRRRGVEGILLGECDFQIAVGGRGKRPGAEFASLKAGAVAGFALVMAQDLGRGKWRWLLKDKDGGYTECADLDDLIVTAAARAS